MFIYPELLNWDLNYELILNGESIKELSRLPSLIFLCKIFKLKNIFRMFFKLDLDTFTSIWD